MTVSALLAQTPSGFVGGLMMVLIYWWPMLLALATLVGLVVFIVRRRSRSQGDTSLNL